MYGVEGKTFLITGGAGYVGKRLAARLLREKAARVLMVDVRKFEVEGAECVVGDLTKDLPNTWFEGVHVVFHIASYGMSGKEKFDRAKTYAVNVGGTRKICEACERNKCHLVYVSTVNVCFNGEEVVDGDDDMSICSHFPTHDSYSASKAEAEKMATKVGCAVRPYGIYGEQEERHFPRMIGYFKWGLMMKMGSPNDKSDW